MVLESTKKIGLEHWDGSIVESSMAETVCKSETADGTGKCR